MVRLIHSPAAPFVLLAVVCILLLAVAACVPPQPQGRVSEEDMATTRDLVKNITIPKLDGAAPSQTETATFALG
ncbi:MAG TPA: hypothetical protein VM537_14945 [Anaerolineae bacterium]|nr:hypothetical protein [Anaerolineae bacterium]